MKDSDLAQLAINLARNTGFAVFPVAADKKPAWAKHEGGHGFHDASSDPEVIDRLFQHPRSALIGVRAGEASGVSILDVDVKHDSARAWWIANERRLPPTRTFRTRSGGLHLLFQHALGVRNSEGDPVKGIDTRGEGGYFISWYAAGFDCLDHTSPAPWPAWLSTFFWPPPKKTRRCNQSSEPLSEVQFEPIKQRAIDRVRNAGDGQRHFRLRSSARLLGGIQASAGFTDEDAIGWLTEAADLEREKKARNTVLWGLDKGRQLPLSEGTRNG